MLPVHDVCVDDGGQGEGADHDAEAGHALGDTQTRDHLDTTASLFLFLSHQVVTEKERWQLKLRDVVTSGGPGLVVVGITIEQ